MGFLIQTRFTGLEKKLDKLELLSKQNLKGLEEVNQHTSNLINNIESKIDDLQQEVVEMYNNNQD